MNDWNLTLDEIEFYLEILERIIRKAEAAP